MTTVSKAAMRDGLTLIIQIAKTVCEGWRETGLPMPQGPMYAALMGKLSLTDFQNIMSILHNQGFNVTHSTIEPGPGLKETLRSMGKDGGG